MSKDTEESFEESTTKVVVRRGRFNILAPREESIDVQFWTPVGTCSASFDVEDEHELRTSPWADIIYTFTRSARRSISTPDRNATRDRVCEWLDENEDAVHRAWLIAEIVDAEAKRDRAVNRLRDMQEQLEAHREAVTLDVF